MKTAPFGAAENQLMEIEVDIVFLILGYVLYRWGKKHGVTEGRRAACKDERLYRLEEDLDELRLKMKKSDSKS